MVYEGVLMQVSNSSQTQMTHHPDNNLGQAGSSVASASGQTLSDPVGGRIDTDQSGALDVDEVAVFIEDRYDFAPDHSALLADYVLTEAGGELESSHMLAGLLGMQSLSGTITADELEAVTYCWNNY